MKPSLLLILIPILILQYSCNTDPEYNYVQYKIKVDQITHPDTISVSDTLILKFDGTVGGDGCHSFSHFEVHKKTNEVKLTLWGRKPGYPTVCPQVIVLLDGKEYKTVVNSPGFFLVKVIQPDNSLLVDSVYVK